MKTSEVGVDLIKKFESVRLKAYKALPTERYYTIGYGHYGKDVKKNSIISLQTAETLLKSDLERFENNVNKYNHIYNFNQNEFDALVSFAYNVGSIDNLTKSGTRTRKEIEKYMIEYNKSGGVVVAGLVARRKKELALFKTPIKKTDRIISLKESDKIKIIIDGIMNGLYGNGDERKEVLYNSIQSLVNKR